MQKQAKRRTGNKKTLKDCTVNFTDIAQEGKAKKSPKSVDRKGNRQETTSHLDQSALPKEAVLSSKTAKNTD